MTKAKMTKAQSVLKKFARQETSATRKAMGNDYEESMGLTFNLMSDERLKEEHEGAVACIICDGGNAYNILNNTYFSDEFGSFDHSKELEKLNTMLKEKGFMIEPYSSCFHVVYED